VRVIEWSVVVAVFPPETSPATSSAAGGLLGWCVHCTGCTQRFQRLMLKGFSKMIFSEIVKRVSKIHNLLILAPKILKQIL
jgi:hypothetical protein